MTKANSAKPNLNFNQQCLRILRCTAQALINSPGGLRFKPGTRPWLDGLQAKQDMWRMQTMAIK